MDFNIFSLKNVILNLLLIISIVNASKLNVPRALLPVFSDVSTKFLIEATEGGCYKWSTTRTDIINLTPVNENFERKCSLQVIVTTVTKEAARNIAVVLAEDVSTKQMLRCDVIVDVIKSLSITTTTRELFMEEAPEDFEIKALDDQGNEFSTLEGVEIEWNIVTLGPKKDAVLRYIKFEDSPYETPSSIADLESDNKKGYKILLEGVKSGSAKIIAKLPHEEYKEIPPCEVQLMVVANLLITPAEVYAMPGDIVPFKVFTLNNGVMTEIAIPDAQYYMESEDTTIASSIKASSKITALKEGKTRIVIQDRNIRQNDPPLKLPAATLYVVNPDYLVINVLPHKNLAILVGDQHDISIEVYSKNHNKLFCGDNIEILTEISPEFFVVKKSQNGTRISGHGMKAAVVNVQARLESIDNPSLGRFRFERPIVANAEIVIYPRIVITPSEVILPWDPTTKPKYDIDLVVKGGDGRFIWTSSDHSVGVVSQTGHVRTHSNGFFEVSAAMLRNHHNRETAKVIILPPSKLEIVEFVMEAEIGSPVYLHVALYAEKIDQYGKAIQIPYTQCQELPFKIRQSDAKFEHNRTDVQPPVGIACGNIAMVGLNVGTSKVTVTYYQDGKALEDSVSVSAYKPLELLQPKSDVVLAVGTSINLIYTGGPRPIIGRQSEHERIVVSENENVASARDLTDPASPPGEDLTVVKVVCRQLGETDIRLIVSNKPSAQHCKSRSASVTTRITCGKPRKIQLQPNFDVADDCPMDTSAGNVAIPNLRSLDIGVSVFDDCGKRFLNISSLVFVWTLTPPKSGKFASKDGTFPQNITEGTIEVADNAYQTLTTTGDFKQLLINCTLDRYNNKILSNMRIKPENPPFKDDTDKDDTVLVTSSLSLYLVDEAYIEPSSITLYNHPGNRRKLPVKQGSSFFELALSTEDVANVKYCESSKEIEIMPKRSGELTVQLKDLCLVSRPATLYVTVVAVGLIRVEMIDKVEIGKCIKCVVRLYDENDNLMEIPDRNMIGVKPIFENKIANIQQDEEDPKEPWGQGEIHYTISGVEVGDTKLTFQVATGDEDIESAPVDLQIFNPLRIHPRNGTILIKSHLQYVAKGGPQPDANIEFVVIQPPKAKVPVLEINNKGVVFGLNMGMAKVNARAVGMHPSTGQKIIYSEDTVDMYVIPLQDIKIKIPITRFQQGVFVPVWCFGTPGDISPLILGTIDNPPIIYKWEVRHSQIADFNTVSKLFGFDYKNIDKVVSSIYGLEPGKTLLHLNVTVAGAIAGKPKLDSVTFSTSIDIEVILPFKFTRPKYLMGDALIMAPFSEIPLQTNLDGTSTVIEYTLPGTGAPSTELLADASVKSNDGRIVTVSEKGLLKSYESLGHTMLIVVGTDELGLKQKISVIVDVKPIQYMTLKVRANWRVHSNTPLSYIPLGTVFTLKATFHDSIGNKFVTGPLDLKVRSSRCDLIRIAEGPEVSSVQISTVKPGVTMIKVWAEGVMNTASYIKLRVEQSVQPVFEDLTTGDIICLYAPVISEYNSPGQWRSSDSKMVFIQPELDIAFVQNKEGVVVLTHSLLSASPLQIQVLPISEIEFFMPRNLILTNGELDTVTRIPLVLHSDKSVGMKTNNLIAGWRCRTDVRVLVRPTIFQCFAKFSNETIETKPEEIFNISNSFVPETGSYACKFVSLGVYDKDIAVLDTDVLMWVVTSDETMTSEILTVKFAPQVYHPSEILIGEGESTTTFELVGLPHVLSQISVEPADSSILYIDQGTMENPTTVKYEVQLIDYHWRIASLEDAMGIHIKSPMTKQDIKIIVKVVGGIASLSCQSGRSPIFNFLFLYKNALLMCLAMLLVFLVTFYFYSHYMQPVVCVNVTGNGGNSCAANMTMDRPRSLNSNRMGSPNNWDRSLVRTANYSPMQRRTVPGSSFVSPNQSNISRCSNASQCQKLNCSCNANTSREPVYGDPSSFYTGSPEIRRNRRGM
ncbi:unnamed protein product [Brassicogethes aeneus]|uniref:Nuclear pore membrane glycoprotein 210 n=1 Tax=Brassicogethes aeneus TaxID=1431903 RepID=A0A9P0FF54_BRAAE|nr:unnamed protein product [Brassicogethes aeneus]